MSYAEYKMLLCNCFEYYYYTMTWEIWELVWWVSCGMADTFLSNPRKKKNPQLVNIKTFSTWIEVEKVCSLSGFIDTKSTHELAPLMLMAKFQQTLREPKSGSMWASKKATLHTAMCLRNNSPFVEAERPCWHHLKPYNRYKFNCDKWTIADNFQKKEGKIIGIDDAKEYVWISG